LKQNPKACLPDHASDLDVSAIHLQIALYPTVPKEESCAEKRTPVILHFGNPANFCAHAGYVALPGTPH
jgi:hypothetical protein